MGRKRREVMHDGDPANDIWDLTQNFVEEAMDRDPTDQENADLDTHAEALGFYEGGVFA